MPPDPQTLACLMRGAEKWIAQGRLDGSNPELREFVIDAADQQCEAVVRRLVAAGFDLEARKDNRDTVLMEAIHRRRRNAVATLLAIGADPNATLPRSTYGPVQLAAQTATPEILALLLNHGARLDAKPGEGPPAFFDAARRDTPEMLRQMLDQGVDVNAADSLGNTALYWAAGGGALRAARFLLDHGAALEAPGHQGKTPLLYAVEFGRADMIAFLVQRGADVHVTIESGGGILHLLGIVSGDAGGIVQTALARGVDVNRRDSAGVTPLMCAAHARDCSSVRLLLAAGAESNVRAHDGTTALLRALTIPEADVVQALLEGGADPSVAAARDGAPLHLAVRDENAEELVDLLLRHGARAAPDYRGATPKQVAAAHGQVGVVGRLERAEAAQSGAAAPAVPSSAVQMASLFRALLRGEPEEVGRWWRGPHRLPATELVATARLMHNASTLMKCAIEYGHLEVVREFLDGGFEPNTDWGDDNSLFHAARCGQADIARLLLERGADPFIENERGGTALTFSISREVAEVICTHRRGAAERFPRIEFPRDFREIPPRPLTRWRPPPPKVRAAPRAPSPPRTGGGASPPPPPSLPRSNPTPPGPAAANFEAAAAPLPPHRGVLSPSFRWGFELFVVVPWLGYITGAIYARLNLYAGSLWPVGLLALFYAAVLALLFRHGQCWRAPNRWLRRSLLIAMVVPIVAGHLLAYRQTQERVFQRVQASAPGRFPAEWMDLNAPTVLSKWLGQTTGRESAGLAGYVRAQTVIEWEGPEGGRAEDRPYRTAVGVCLAWLIHAVMIALGAAVGCVAGVAARS